MGPPQDARSVLAKVSWKKLPSNCRGLKDEAVCGTAKPCEAPLGWQVEIPASWHTGKDEKIPTDARSARTGVILTESTGRVKPPRPHGWQGATTPQSKV